MKKLLLIGMCFSLSACGGMTIQSIYGGMTSGVIGCAPEEIKITNFKSTNFQTDDTYIAECKGKRFYCSYHDVRSNSAGKPSCAPEL